jgi:hypothetical protein
MRETTPFSLIGLFPSNSDEKAWCAMTGHSDAERDREEYREKSAFHRELLSRLPLRRLFLQPEHR